MTRTVRTVTLLLLGAIAGCGSNALQAQDMAAKGPDLSAAPDMTAKTCGDIIMCLLGAGGGGGGGLTTCISRASPVGGRQGTGLAGCGASCLKAGDGGMPSQTQVGVCLLQNCSSQLSACQGLKL